MSVNYGFQATILAVFVLWQFLAYAGEPRPPTSPAAVKELMKKDLIGAGKEMLMLTVEYIPGGASLPHRHDAQVFVYVLQGELSMQVEGSPAVKLQPGETFYENPADVHLISANASPTKPAKILVFIVKDKNVPVSRDVASKVKP